MADLTEAKRQMQAGHQATLKIFDKQGAKAVKPNAPQMRPTHTDTTPRLSLLSPSSGSIIDQHTGCEDACFKRIALMTKNFPEDVLKRGCQTTVTVLCLEKDLKVKAMLDTGCSPNNYMREEYFEANKANLSQYEIRESPERVDLATSDQPIRLYIEAIQNDAMLGLATGAFEDFPSWYESLLSYIRMPDCPEPQGQDQRPNKQGNADSTENNQQMEERHQSKG
jgi:hypothetical protein